MGDGPAVGAGMDELGFYVPSTVIWRQWKGEHERLCAMKRHADALVGAGRGAWWHARHN